MAAITTASPDDVLRIAVGLDDLRRRLKIEAGAGNYEGVMAIYASMRGIELDVMGLTTLAGKLATDLVMR
jgi:hypothetical protein